MKRFVYILIAALALAGCVKDEYFHPSEADAPQTASAYEPIITVDQEINQVTFSVDAKAVIPVWLFQDKNGEFTEYKAQNGFKRIFATSGDYKVRMKIMNASGVTPDYVEKTFHIDNTIASFDKFVTFLAGGTSESNTKTWHIDGDVEAHMGCGSSGTIGVEWWSAQPGDKAAFGVYEDKVTFGGAGAYSYDPGEDGGVYVNKDVTVSLFADQKGANTEDYVAAVEPQTSTYKFEYRGNDLYLVLAEHTLFPYIDNDDFWAKPELQVINITRESMELVHDNGSIAWHYILTSKAGAVVFKGFAYNADSNLWKAADAEGGLTLGYYYAPGWAQIADPELAHSGNEYTWTLPEATSDRWQAQVFMVPTQNISLTEDKHYDFSVILNSNVDVTPKLKIHRMDEGGSDADNGVVLMDVDVPLKAGEQKVFYATDLAGIAANNIRFVLDFGGNPAGAVISAERIVLKDHAIDDGTVLPGEEPENPDAPTGFTYGDNLLGGLYLKDTWFSPANWAGGLDPNASFEGGVLTLTTPAEIGGSEWQGQVKLVADIPADPVKQYAFFATIESGAAGPITIKLADANNDNDNAFFYDNGVQLEAFAPMAYKNEPVAPNQAYEAVMVIFDFGRIPAGTDIKVTNIELREITGTAGGGGNTYGDELLSGLSLKETWFSPANWAGGLDPNAVFENGKLTLTTPAEIGGSEWQGQVKLVANVPADPEKQYAFAATIESSIGGPVTVKLADANDDSNHAFFYDNGVQLEAFAPMAYKNEPVSPDQAYEAIMVIFDFGRIPAGAEITVTGISLREITGTAGGGSDAGGSYGDNIFAGQGELETWFSPASWAGGLDPQATYEGGKVKLTVPEGVGGSEWMGQVKIHTGIAIDKTKQYSYKAVVTTSTSGTITAKLTADSDPGGNEFFYDGGIAVEAYDDTVIEKAPVTMDIDNETFMIIFDFGRLAAGSEVEISGIEIRPQL